MWACDIVSFVMQPMRIDTTLTVVFQDKSVPADTRLAGWAALARTLFIAGPVRRPSCVSSQHIFRNRREQGDWTIFDKRYWPGDTLADHLLFALRHEGLDLLILKRVFDAVPQEEIEALVRAAPTGALVRRVWYLYETMLGRTLEVEDAPRAAPVDLLEPKRYFTGVPRLSKRHRVRDNLLGNARFCPIIRRTATLADFVALDLAAQAQAVVGRTGANLVARAASFLLLADSRASFEIEGERPPRNRLERWGRAVLQAGRNRLTLEEIIRLQHVLIEDPRFVRAGLRTDGVFLGERDHLHDPLPEFIGARPDDLYDLMEGLLEANDRMGEDGVDPVLSAAATAFGFVYIHPFQDGNGRMHRCLIHHVLAERSFTPPGIVFPVSAVMLDRVDEYRGTLQDHSGPLMPFIQWRSTPEHNVEVLNETADFYRYYDCTEEAEFLYECVARTVQHDLPREIDYISRRAEAVSRIMDAVEMPDRVAENLVMFIRHNEGALPKKRRTGEFRELRDDEVTLIEDIVKDAFAGFVGGAGDGGGAEDLA